MYHRALRPIFMLSLLCLLSCGGSDNGSDPTGPGNPPGGGSTLMFIHHSVGEGFLFDGGMLDLLVAAGYDLHHRTYGDGWVGDNTDPENWPITFTTYYDDMTTWQLPAGTRYRIVAFKSCFPASQIDSEQKLADYQSYYETVKSVTRQHPETMFIPFTIPPLVPAETDPESAARARRFAAWLAGPYSAGESNLVTYDLFTRLAGSDPASGDFNCLRYDYQADPYDSHPNSTANHLMAADFTAFVSSVLPAAARQHGRARPMLRPAARE